MGGADTKIARRSRRTGVETSREPGVIPDSVKKSVVSDSKVKSDLDPSLHHDRRLDP